MGTCPLYPQERTLGGASDLSKQHHYSIIDGGSMELALQPLLDLIPSDEDCDDRRAD
jgi:hypothetical protein